MHHVRLLAYEYNVERGAAKVEQVREVARHGVERDEYTRFAVGQDMGDLARLQTGVQRYENRPDAAASEQAFDDLGSIGKPYGHAVPSAYTALQEAPRYANAGAPELLICLILVSEAQRYGIRRARGSQID